MKIIHVVSSLNVGGAERFVIDLAAEQKKSQQFNIDILSMGAKGEPLEEEVRRFELGLLHSSSILALRKKLATADFVHVHSSYCLLRVLLATIFTTTKVIYTRHNERVHKTLKWRLVYLLAKLKLHKMIFVADKARTNYLETYRSFEKKSIIILNGVLPMTPVKTSNKKVRISHVGRFVPLKAQHLLIEAVALLPSDLQQKLCVSFFGTGELMEKNQLLAKRLIPDVEVNFRGFVTDRDEIYGHTDILAVTSETEGLSLAILEALASGTPTIASNVGGNPELIEDNVNGYLYSYADTQQLANCITLLLTNPATYQSFSINSLEKFKNGFSMQICADNYLRAYH
ncbi:glycosyltransferase family 4 protein [Thalassotalea castellviae]|uniref:Glycosyltransferase family 4 protein n=1 Tax=Thalassotalea castellviae TaxID=3075612 RepID=A0ABU3A0V5_9GAMM|nr:glycosyltransferase family 4 protein [Thalassotalea sp. W431]MDT0603806.1 glycosyltransferase family 4 protein [Thalassotalea sp. W431]